MAFSWAARCSAKRDATEGVSYRPHKQRRPPARQIEDLLAFIRDRGLGTAAKFCSLIRDIRATPPAAGVGPGALNPLVVNGFNERVFGGKPNSDMSEFTVNLSHTRVSSPRRVPGHPLGSTIRRFHAGVRFPIVYGVARLL